MINKSKEFKRGNSEYDRMVTRISKLESEVDLYKKVVAKAEKDARKEKQNFINKIQFVENENVKLLAEIRTLKEDREIE